MSVTTRGLEEQLTTTGIEELDRLLSGGIPRGSTALILCEGQNAQDASALLGIISLNVLERGETVILLTTDPPNETYPQLYAPDITSAALRENRLFYIDLFSSSMGVQTSEDSNIVVVEKPHDLNHVFYHTSMFRDEKLKEIPWPGLKVSWIYNQLSTTIFTVGDPDKVLRFIWNLRSKIKTLRDVAYTVMNMDMHEKRVVETAKHIFDTVFELKTVEKEGISIKQLRVIKNAGLPCITDPVPYSVEMRKRKFLVGSEIATSFEELKKMFYIDPSGQLRLPIYDQLARYLVLPVNIILNIIKKANDNNLLDATRSQLEFAGYKTAKALSHIFKEKYQISGNKNLEHCSRILYVFGWGKLSYQLEEDNDTIRVFIENSPIISSLRKLNKPICYTQIGFLKGTLEEAYASRYDVEEIRCVGLGDEHCEFLATRIESAEAPIKISEMESLELLSPLITTSKTKLKEFKEKIIQKNRELLQEKLLNFKQLPEKLSELFASLGYKANLLEVGEESLIYQISDCRYQNKEKALHDVHMAYLEALLEAMGIKTVISIEQDESAKNKCVIKINKA
ncbi:MAG: V4R domain-containing protein [Candidatus Jordarchaeum sp.]|uniref:V4R domain-containing protein n=1 Tax=Candidatus Jordarchaeum sp. TaxID=2823881 RepID=UPI004049EA27